MEDKNVAPIVRIKAQFAAILSSWKQKVLRVAVHLHIELPIERIVFQDGIAFDQSLHDAGKVWYNGVRVINAPCKKTVALFWVFVFAIYFLVLIIPSVNYFRM